MAVEKLYQRVGKSKTIACNLLGPLQPQQMSSWHKCPDTSVQGTNFQYTAQGQDTHRAGVFLFGGQKPSSSHTCWKRKHSILVLDTVGHWGWPSTSGSSLTLESCDLFRPRTLTANGSYWVLDCVLSGLIILCPIIQKTEFGVAPGTQKSHTFFLWRTKLGGYSQTR